MSVENHPNINTVGLASAVVEAVVNYARGKADGYALTPEVTDLITGFCNDVSESLDNSFPPDK